MIQVFRREDTESVMQALLSKLEGCTYDGEAIFYDAEGEPVCALYAAGDKYGQCVCMHDGWAPTILNACLEYFIKEVIEIKIPGLNMEAVRHKLRHTNGVDIAADPIFYLHGGSVRVYVDPIEVIITGYGTISSAQKVMACAKALLSKE